ncbi:hypothetical protein BHYA_0029g00350 [Botrytis hyacinthi]|uniref:Uncharacterized protein n=1 Tax=Botrytis hyacinthi TaxID=278943 RepID=A0A4Z1GWD9_9HELO|nr:hypothetical protein BHYA_0029g00350 [Botrytis hyacinthi]
MSKPSQENHDSTSDESIIGAEEDTAAKEYGMNINSNKSERVNRLALPHPHSRVIQSTRIRKTIREYAEIHNEN